MATYKDCYAGPGVVLDTSPTKGRNTGANQFGAKAAELPIIYDYVRKTNPGAPFALALLAGETNCDWWDKGGLLEPYFDLLQRRHPQLKRADLEANRHKVPDILTCNGTLHLLPFGRHEFYEIKPDNDKGIRDGQEKLEFIEQTYRKKVYRLPYRRGSYYPDSNALAASMPIEIKLPFNSIFKYLMRVLMKKGGFTRMRIYLQLRRPEDGLLLYKLCIELQDEDRKRRRQKVLTKAIAKHVYATYLATHYPQDIAQLLPPLGDFSYEGDQLPNIRCHWNVVDEIDGYKAQLESMVYTRGVGVPGDRFVVYCDEAVWQYLVRPASVSDIWGRIKAAAQASLQRAGHGAVWSRVEPLIVQAEDAAELVRRTVEEKSLIDIEAMADVLLAFVQKNPGTAIAIALTPLFICAGVAALLEGGLLASAVAGSEAGVAAGALEPSASALGRIAMAEEILLGTRAGAGVPAVLTPGAVINGAAAGTGNVFALRTAIASPALKTTVKATAMAASFLLMSMHTQAFAMGATLPARNADGTPEIPDGAKLIAERVSGLGLAPMSDAPSMKPPAKGKQVNLRDLIDVPRPLDFDKPFDPPPAIWVRYLGTMTVG